jgi:hypothetical protein
MEMSIRQVPVYSRTGALLGIDRTITIVGATNEQVRALLMKLPASLSKTA